MKNKGLVILTGVVALVVGYAVYDYQSEKNSDKKKEEGSVLVKLNKDQIDEFEIARPGDPVLKLQRTPEGWKILSPISETAEQSSVVDFVAAMTLEKYNDLVKEGEGIDWKIYGLDKPKGIITFKSTEGKSVSVDVASKNNFSNDPYLKIEGENKVFTGSSTWSARADKKAFDFRDKRLMRISQALAQNVKVVRGSEKLFIEKKDGAWLAPEHKNWKLDQTKTGEIAYMLNNTAAMDIEREGHIGAKDLKEFGLLKPIFTVEVGLKDNKKWKADFGINEKMEYFARVYEPSFIMKIAIQDLEKIQNISLSALRDHREPFNFNRDDVKKINLNLADKDVEFERLPAGSKQDWKVTKEDKALEYKLEKIPSVLSQLSNLEAVDLEASKAIKTKKIIELKAQDGKSIFKLSLGPSYKKKIEGLEKNLILVQSNLYKNAVGVDESTFKRIGLDDLAKERSKAETKK